MSLRDRVRARYQTRYWEGEASGAAVLVPYGGDSNREAALQQIVARARDAYVANGIVFAVILLRQMLLSQASFKLRNKVDKSLYGTEDLRILEYPWPNGTTGDLWSRMDQDISLSGNAYIWKAEDDLLVRLPPSEVTIISQMVASSRSPEGSYRRVIGYEWAPNRNLPGISQDRRAMFLPVEDVAHWYPIPDPDANFRGMSWLTSVLREVHADSGMTEYKSKYVDHGTPVVAVKYPSRLRPETIDAVRTQLTTKYGGAGNAFKPLVFDQGADPTLGGGLKDLDYAAVQGAGVERICAAGGVEPLLLGMSSGARQVGAAYSDAKDKFGNLTGRWLWQSGCASLQKLVPNIPPRGVELWFDTTDIAALQAAETERAQVTQVHAAAILALRQAGATLESATAAVTSGDLTQVELDPNAPPPGQRVGTPPGGGQVLTNAQTPASKIPAPESFATPAVMGSGTAKNPTANGSH